MAQRFHDTNLSKLLTTFKSDMFCITPYQVPSAYTDSRSCTICTIPIPIPPPPPLHQFIQHKTIRHLQAGGSVHQISIPKKEGGA